MTGLKPVCADTDFGQMVVIPVPALKADLLQETLFKRYRIEIPVTSHKHYRFLRLSVQGYNTREDTDALVAAVRAIYRL